MSRSADDRRALSPARDRQRRAADVSAGRTTGPFLPASAARPSSTPLLDGGKALPGGGNGKPPPGTRDETQRHRVQQGDPVLGRQPGARRTRGGTHAHSPMGGAGGRSDRPDQDAAGDDDGAERRSGRAGLAQPREG